MTTMQSRSVSWAIGVIVLGMVLVILGVVNGALFLPGIWVLVVGFLGLIAASLYALVRERA